jgi:hypothetical protein
MKWPPLYAASGWYLYFVDDAEKMAAEWAFEIVIGYWTQFFYSNGIAKADKLERGFVGGLPPAGPSHGGRQARCAAASGGSKDYGTVAGRRPSGCST